MAVADRANDAATLPMPDHLPREGKVRHAPARPLMCRHLPGCRPGISKDAGITPTRNQPESDANDWSSSRIGAISVDFDHDFA